MPGCSAYGCRNTHVTKNGGKKMKLFRFPADPVRRRVWEDRVNRASWTPTRSSVLCQDHFEPTQFEANRQDGWRKLKQTAVPTIFSDHILPRHRKILRLPENGEEVHQNVKQTEGGVLPRKRRFRTLPPPTTLLGHPKQPEAPAEHLYDRCTEAGIKQERPDSPHGQDCTNSFPVAHLTSNHEATSLALKTMDLNSVDLNSVALKSVNVKSEVLETVDHNNVDFENVFIKEERLESPRISPLNSPNNSPVREAEDSTLRPLVIKQEPPDPLRSPSPPVVGEVEGRDTGTGDTTGNDLAPSAIGFNMPLAVELAIPQTFDLHKEQIAFLKVKIRDLQRQIRKGKGKQETFNRNIRRLFNPDQITALSGTSTRGQKWSKETLKKAAQIRLLCGKKGYEDLLTKGYPLPCLRTLRREKEMCVSGIVDSDQDNESSLTVGSEGVGDENSESTSFLEVDGEGLLDKIKQEIEDS